jgi:hypothetical protein
MRRELAMAVRHLGAKYLWELFEQVGTLYSFGKLLPSKDIAWLKGLGYDGVLRMLLPAEELLAKQFPEFATMQKGTASHHLT